MSNKLGLSAPWESYVSEITALFDKDPEVAIDYSEENKVLKLYVDSQEKAAALEQLLKPEVDFGNVKLSIEIIPANLTDRSVMNLFETAFKGNQAVSYTRSIEAMGWSAGYIVFKPEIVQYFNDDLSDINGIESTLYEDIAKRVFADNHDGVFFCTDVANQALLGKPLGEWP